MSQYLDKVVDVFRAEQQVNNGDSELRDVDADRHTLPRICIEIKERTEQGDRQPAVRSRGTACDNVPGTQAIG